MTRQLLRELGGCLQTPRYHDGPSPTRLVLWYDFGNSVKGDTMLSLNAPSQTTFLVSLVIVIIAWIAYFASVPFFGEHPSGHLTVAYAASERHSM